MEYLYNLLIAIFGSLSGAAVGCWLAHKYLRRTTVDALAEAQALAESSEMYRALQSLNDESLSSNAVPVFETNNGQQYYLKNIIALDHDIMRAKCTTPLIEKRAASIGVEP